MIILDTYIQDFFEYPFLFYMTVFHDEVKKNTVFTFPQAPTTTSLSALNFRIIVFTKPQLSTQVRYITKVCHQAIEQ